MRITLHLSAFQQYAHLSLLLERILETVLNSPKYDLPLIFCLVSAVAAILICFVFSFLLSFTNLFSPFNIYINKMIAKITFKVTHDHIQRILDHGSEISSSTADLTCFCKHLVDNKNILKGKIDWEERNYRYIMDY